MNELLNELIDQAIDKAWNYFETIGDTIDENKEYLNQYQARIFHLRNHNLLDVMKQNFRHAQGSLEIKEALVFLSDQADRLDLDITNFRYRNDPDKGAHDRA